MVNPVELLSRTDEVITFFVLFHCIWIGLSANGTESVAVILVVRLCGIALGIAVGERVVGILGPVAT